MRTKIETFLKDYIKNDIPEIRPGDTVKIVRKIKEGDKERRTSFKGTVISRKHGKGISATITVRRIIAGAGVEKTFPIHSPATEKIELLKRGKVKRAKLYYLRKTKGRKVRIKRAELKEKIELSNKVTKKLEKASEKTDEKAGEKREEK